MERNNDSDSFERVVKNQEEKKKDVCFDDIVKEATKVDKDVREAMTLVTGRVAMKFISFLMKNEEESKKPVSLSQISLGFSVPKRKRGSCGKRDDSNQRLVNDFDHSPDEEEEDHKEGREFRRNNNGNQSFDDIPDHSNNVDDEESKRRNHKKKLGKKPVPSKPNLEEEEKLIPDDFQRKIGNLGGGDIKLVLEKRLTKTDMDKGQGKLSIPVKQVRRRFLRPEEEEILGQSRDDGRGLKGINVTFIEPSCERCDGMVLKRWVMRTGGIYALNQGWNSVVERNKLKEGATVQVWSFRIKTDNGSGGGGICVETDRGDDEGELGFALVLLSGVGGVGSSGSGEECGTSSTKTEDIGSGSHGSFSDIVVD